MKFISVTDRFMRFVKKPDNLDACWIWTGTADKARIRYGSFWMNGANLLAHRVAYSLFKGEIPKGRYVTHKCDNKICVNPEHLVIGDAITNTAEAHQRGKIINLRKIDRNLVINTMRSGLSYREAASKLGISPKTINGIL